MRRTRGLTVNVTSTISSSVGSLCFVPLLLAKLHSILPEASGGGFGSVANGSSLKVRREGRPPKRHRVRHATEDGRYRQGVYRPASSRAVTRSRTACGWPMGSTG